MRGWVRDMTERNRDSSLIDTIAADRVPADSRRRRPQLARECASEPKLAAGTPDALLNAALTYASRGWPVFPCSGTKPFAASHGFLDATTDKEQITEWWRRYRRANVAIATGGAQLVVLDADPRHGGDQSLQRLILDHGPEVYDTLRATTGRGGTHMYFQRPAGVNIRDSAGTLAPGLDIRAIGGYAIAPPSRRPNGRYYAWVQGTEGEPPMLPASLIPLLISARRQRGDISDGAPVTEGERNDRLFRLGCGLRATGFTLHEVGAALQTINELRCRPPLDPDEVRRITDSVARYQLGVDRIRRPRVLVHTVGCHD